MDGGWFIRSLDLSFFQFFFLAIKNPRPSLLSASRASPVYSYGAYARAYCSGLLLGLRSANE
jgi:hypothetical protein